MEWASKRDCHELCKWWKRLEDFKYEPFKSFNYTEYNSDTAYAVGAIVMDNGTLYECISATTAGTPTSNTNKWIKINPSALDDDFIMKRPPEGTFYAKEVSSETYDNGTIGGTFLFDRTTVTIRTPDNVIGMKNNCIVLYQGEKWKVVSVQRKNIRNGMAEFAPENIIPHFFFITMRK